MRFGKGSWSGLALASLGLCLGVCGAQVALPQAVTDSSVQASPLNPLPRQPVVDAAVNASPITPEHHGGRYIAPRTAIPINLEESIDSGRLKNGQTLRAKLGSAVHAGGGPDFPAGTPVVVTVVETVPAGKINAVGEFSLQVMRVGGVDVFTDTQTFRGKPGHQDLPDSAPAVGTDAGLASGAALTFHVQPPPQPAGASPKPSGAEPGSVNGVASGGPPPADAAKGLHPGNPSTGAGSKNTPNTVVPANTTTTGARQSGGTVGVTPSQAASPNAQPSTVTPH